MSCFSCGKAFKGDVNDLLARYKRQYLEHGIERFFYKTTQKGDIKIGVMSDFKRIFKDEIKPNFDRGAEYALIQEYNPKNG